MTPRDCAGEVAAWWLLALEAMVRGAEAEAV